MYFNLAIRKLLLFWKPVIWLALICYGLFLPVNNLPMKSFLNIPYFDKMVHFSLFFVLCILFYRPFKLLNLKQYIWAPLFAIALSGLLEFIQHSISSSRHTDIFDFAANTTGVMVSVLFYHFFVNGKKWEKLF